jgi:hypothetical protein
MGHRRRWRSTYWVCMSIDFSVRLVLCANGVAVGPRLHRDKPFPRNELSYADTPEGRERAESDLARIQKYVEDYDKK